jgi:hypothetical protein
VYARRVQLFCLQRMASPVLLTYSGMGLPGGDPNSTLGRTPRANPALSLLRKSARTLQLQFADILECGRKAVLRQPKPMWDSRRRWLAGKPLDEPVRGYQRYGEGADGKVVPIRASRPQSPKRKPPFAKEMALLRCLGLR